MILLGKLGYPRSANVDFDKKEEGKGFAYFFEKAIKAAFGMEK